MACASQSMISAYTYTFTSPRLFKNCRSLDRYNLKLSTVRASSDDADCKDEECAPDKEPTQELQVLLNGAENTKAIAAGFVLISIAVASSILIQVGKPPTRMQTVEYSGLSLGYYSNRFKPSEIVAAVPSQAESSPSIQPENSASEAPQIRAQS